METILKVLRAIRWIIAEGIQIIGVVLMAYSLFAKNSAQAFFGICLLAFGMLVECLLRLEDLEKKGERVIVHIHDSAPDSEEGE